MNFKSLSDVERSGLSEYAKHQIREQYAKATIRNRTADTASDLEQSFICKQVGKKKDPRFINPVRIDIFSSRKRETDNRAISEKAVIDAIVKIGILKNDTKEYIKELKVYEPEISEDEKTLIVIEEM